MISVPGAAWLEARLGMTASVVGSGDRVSGGASNSPCLHLKVLLLYLYLVAVPGWPSFGSGPEGAQPQQKHLLDDGSVKPDVPGTEPGHARARKLSSHSAGQP